MKDIKNVENEVSEESNNPISEWNKTQGKTDHRNPIIRILEKFGDLFALNLIFVLSCLPIVTIGAAFVNLFYITNKMLLNHEETMWNGYWKGFKKNFAIGSKLLIFWVIYFAVMYFEYFYMIGCEDTFTSNIIMIIIGLELVFLSLTLPIVFPLAARYENGLLRHLLNSLIISISNFKTWGILFIFWLLPIFIMALQPLIFAYTWYFWVLILFAVVAYSSSMVLQNLYNKLESPDSSDSEQ